MSRARILRSVSTTPADRPAAASRAGSSQLRVIPALEDRANLSIELWYWGKQMASSTELASSLPPLTRAETEHSARLRARITAEIEAQGGWISFARYMEMALYEPGLGYYSAGAAKFGAGGDFITAPEISSLFSRCVAAQCAQVLKAMGGGG